MNRRESDLRMASDNRFRAVAMVGVEIPDRDPLRSVREGIERSDRDVIKEAKAHRLIAGRVMPGRSHQAESRCSA